MNKIPSDQFYTGILPSSTIAIHLAHDYPVCWAGQSASQWLLMLKNANTETNTTRVVSDCNNELARAQEYCDVGSQSV